MPTTKHHDGICLWEAPGTTRNTVARGPRRDLIGALAAATRRAGLHFGAYYSGGLDWGFTDFDPITYDVDDTNRPLDEAYTRYANAHVLDLIRRYAPDVLWGDIDWPDAGKPDGPLSFAHVLDALYAAAPNAVVNDRFGATHWDFRTSEYQAGRDLEDGAWENCRGIGLSFGYNQLEGPEHHLDGPGAVRHLLDVVSRGGNFLLDVGPTATGRIPDLQYSCLQGLGDWMSVHGEAVHRTTPVDASIATPTDAGGRDAWVRWTRSGSVVHAIVDADGAVPLRIDGAAVDLAAARLADGSAVAARPQDGTVVIDLPTPQIAGPTVITLPLIR